MIKWSLSELASVDSTQDVIRKLAADGAPEGTVVVAKRQTAGRGRHGRSWVSPDGGLYMSLLLRPPPSAQPRTITMASSLAVARGMVKATGLAASIRWPNDVMIRGRKAAGVIAESSYTGQTPSFIAVGIGVNCNSKVVSEDSWGPATSIAEELGGEVDIANLRRAILEEFSIVHEGWLRGGDVVGTARSEVGTIGKRVGVVMKSGENLEGLAVDIEPTGGLVLELAGRRRIIRAEDVERLRET